MRRENQPQGGGVLPTGYTQLEYIESTGTQWIDTGFKLNNNSRVVIEYMITQYQSAYSHPICPFGARRGYNNTQYIVMCPVNRATSMAIGYENNTRFQEIYNILNNHIVIDMNKNVANWTVGNDSYNYTFSTSAFQTQGNCYVFKNNYYNELSQYNGIDPGQTDGKMRLFGMEIYDNGTIARDYVPTLRTQDGKPGLYDIINNTFYTNSGTGEFLYA